MREKTVVWLVGLGAVQLVLWCGVAFSTARFTPGSDFGQRPLIPVLMAMAAGFTLYLASLTLVWNQPRARSAARAQFWLVLIFAVLFRLPLLWSQPIQEIDLYRYLWDGRSLAAGVNPYQHSPAQVDLALERGPATPELERLTRILRRSPEVTAIFERIDHRTVPTIYPPLSQAVFAAAALVTPERASVPAQVRALKALLLTFDLATIAFIIGLLRNLRLPPGRALAYAWCPLVLKEIANSGHLDTIAVCLTAAMFWLLTRPARKSSTPGHSSTPLHPTTRDWLASGLWAGAILAKLYPLVLGPVLLAYGWRRMGWRIGGPLAMALVIVLAGFAAFGRGPTLGRSNTQATPTTEAGATTLVSPAVHHSTVSGLGEFLRRWEMNNLLFSILYENIRTHRGDDLRPEPWYTVVPAGFREPLHTILSRLAATTGAGIPRSRLAFLFTQALVATIMLTIACGLAWRRWPDDPREALLGRSFLCLAWLWFLSATQNPWYWTWAMPLVIFAGRPWLLVSGFALIYYLRFWFVYHFPDSTLPGGLNGRRFFDEGVVWVEHLPVLLLVALAWFLGRRGQRPLSDPIEMDSSAPGSSRRQ